MRRFCDDNYKVLYQYWLKLPNKDLQYWEIEDNYGNWCLGNTPRADNSYLDYNSDGSNFPKHTEISFEDFKRLVMKKNTDKKIIGYKCPTDLFGHSILKGTIFIKDSPGNYWYWPKGSGSSGQTVPAEIVETWEPVYEAKFKVGDYVIAIKQDGGLPIGTVGKVKEIVDWKHASSEGDSHVLYLERRPNSPHYLSYFRLATQVEIKDYSEVKIGSYKITFQPGVCTIGCTTYTKAQVETVKTVLQYTNSPEVSFDGILITLDICNKLLAQI